MSDCSIAGTEQAIPEDIKSNFRKFCPTSSSDYEDYGRFYGKSGFLTICNGSNDEDNSSIKPKKTVLA